MVAYLVVGWFLVQLASSTFGPLGLPEWSQRALIIAIAVAFIPVCALAWIFDLTTTGIVRTPELPSTDQAAASVLLPATSSWAATTQPHIASIAILPFSDMSQARDQDWFCDGLAEEIIDALCCVNGLRVADPRHSGFAAMQRSHGAKRRLTGTTALRRFSAVRD